MRFRSCFLLSTLWVFGFPIAVPKEGSLDEASLVRDDALFSEDFSDSLITSPPSTGPLSTSLTSGGGDIINQPVSDRAKQPSDSSGSTLLAQTTYGNGAGVDPITGLIWSGVGAGVGLLLDGIHDVKQLFQDHHTTEVKVTDPNSFIKNPPSENDKAGAATQPGRATPNTATNTGGTDADGLCPPEEFGERIMPWCDRGTPGNIGLIQGTPIMTVIGYPCR